MYPDGNNKVYDGNTVNSSYEPTASLFSGYVFSQWGRNSNDANLATFVLDHYSGGVVDNSYTIVVAKLEVLDSDDASYQIDNSGGLTAGSLNEWIEIP